MLELRKLLVAYDGSESSCKAFRFALEFAKAFHASILVLSVAQFPEPATMVETQAMLESATEHFQKDLDEFRGQARRADIFLETKIVVGHASEQIVYWADQEHVDLIVMGHRGKSLVQRWLLGSVSKRVITYAPCSVTVVR